MFRYIHGRFGPLNWDRIPDATGLFFGGFPIFHHVVNSKIVVLGIVIRSLV